MHGTTNVKFDNFDKTSLINVITWLKLCSVNAEIVFLPLSLWVVRMQYTITTLIAARWGKAKTARRKVKFASNYLHEPSWCTSEYAHQLYGCRISLYRWIIIISGALEYKLRLISIHHHCETFKRKRSIIHTLYKYFTYIPSRSNFLSLEFWP